MLNSTLQNKGAFRIKDWWQSKAALLMGMVYLFAVWFEIGFDQLLRLSALSIITISGFASLGYLLNDFFDREKDALSGKKNFLAGKSAPVITCCFVIAVIALLLPWKWLPFNYFSALCIGLQIMLFIVYSVPPLRLKERGIPGIVTDALYAHALPVLLAAYTFSLAAEKRLVLVPACLLFGWQALSGVRNILLHQFDDMQSDRKSRSVNFVAGINPVIFFKSVRNLLIAEVTLSLVFLGILLPENRLPAVGMFTIIALSLAALRLFHNKSISEFLESKWKFFPNNIYEKWLPPAFLFALMLTDLRFGWLLAVHLLLFNLNFIRQATYFVWYALRQIYHKAAQPVFHVLFVKIPEAVFETCKLLYYEANKLKWRIFIACSLLGNHLVYYCFLVFGVDLKKQNTSALDYFRNKKKPKKMQPPKAEAQQNV